MCVQEEIGAMVTRRFLPKLFPFFSCPRLSFSPNTVTTKKLQLLIYLIYPSLSLANKRRANVKLILPENMMEFYCNLVYHEVN